MEFEDRALEILNDVGVYIDEVTPEMTISELIEDSLTFLSFFIELEKEYQIELPDEFFSEDINEKSIADIKEMVMAMAR